LAVRIRLKRKGRKKSASYRVVVAESTTPRNGKTVDDLGFYNPVSEPKQFHVDEERVKYWLGVGALPSDTVYRLLEAVNLVPKVTRASKNVGVSKKQLKEQASS